MIQELAKPQENQMGKVEVQEFVGQVTIWYHQPRGSASVRKRMEDHVTLQIKSHLLYRMEVRLVTSACPLVVPW